MCYWSVWWKAFCSIILCTESSQRLLRIHYHSNGCHCRMTASSFYPNTAFNKHQERRMNMCLLRSAAKNHKSQFMSRRTLAYKMNTSGKISMKENFQKTWSFSLWFRTIFYMFKCNVFSDKGMKNALILCCFFYEEWDILQIDWQASLQKLNFRKSYNNLVESCKIL